MVRCGLGLTVGPSHGPGVRRQAVVVVVVVPKYQPTATVAGGGQQAAAQAPGTSLRDAEPNTPTGRGLPAYMTDGRRARAR